MPSEKANLKGQAWVELPGHVMATTDKAVKYSVPGGNFPPRLVWIPRSLTQGTPVEYGRLLVREWYIIKNGLMALEGAGKNAKIKGIGYTYGR